MAEDICLTHAGVSYAKHQPLTVHAIKRCMQRSIPVEAINKAVEIGEAESRPGGVTRYAVASKTVDALIAAHQKEIAILERCRGLAVIVGDAGKVVTSYRKRKSKHIRRTPNIYVF